jgi:hypothetical protein
VLLDIRREDRERAKRSRNGECTSSCGGQPQAGPAKPTSTQQSSDGKNGTYVVCLRAPCIFSHTRPVGQAGGSWNSWCHSVVTCSSFWNGFVTCTAHSGVSKACICSCQKFTSDVSMCFASNSISNCVSFKSLSRLSCGPQGHASSRSNAPWTAWAGAVANMGFCQNEAICPGNSICASVCRQTRRKARP